MKLDVLVVGSINVDMIVRVPILPSPGATVTGGTFERHGGGKGANQAVAAARLGARVGMIAAVGDDPAGVEALADLQRDGVEVAAIAKLPDTATGVALIVVDDFGENQIAVASGANQDLNAEMVRTALANIELSPEGVCLLGFEVADEVIEVAAQWASARGALVVVNPAPARPLRQTLAACAPILTPNAGEASELSGEASPVAAAAALARRTGNSVVVTMGELGVVVASDGRVDEFASYATDVIDTTGAGDAFSGALAAALSELRPLVEAINRAQAAAAISTRALGARAGLPTGAEVEQYLIGRGSAPTRATPNPEERRAQTLRQAPGT